MANAAAITLYVKPGSILPDNDQWTNRFTIPSSSSSRVYTIAQNKKGRYWGCDCPGWRRHRHCHHLDELGLPSYMQPFEVQLTEGKK
jgi:hypothetical protein